MVWTAKEVKNSLLVGSPKCVACDVLDTEQKFIMI